MARRGQGPSYETLSTELKKGTLHPAYLLWGEECFLTARAENEIVHAALDGESGDAFSVARYDSLAGSLSEAIASANELPMLKARRVVVFRGITVRDAYGGAKVPVRKPEREALRAYLDAPNPTTVLILTGEVTDHRQKFLTGAKKLRVYEMRPPTAERLLRWVAGKAASCGFAVDPEAAVELIERVGTSMIALSVEIEKLSLYMEEGATADAQTVAQLSEGDVGTSIYEISDAIGREDASGAVGALREVMELHGDGETRAMAELRRSFTLWLRVRQGIDAGEELGELSSSLHLPPFVVRRSISVAKRFSVSTLVELVSAVVDTERRLKLGGGGVAAELELLVTRAASTGAPGPSLTA